MILTKEQIREVTDEEGVYDCRLVNQSFAYALFNDNVSPLGDIICFCSPARVGILNIEQAFVVAVELPNVDKFGSVCFQRLYATQLGSLLTLFTNEQYYLNESSLFCNDLQASLVLFSKIKESGTFNMIFPITMFKNKERFAMLNLEHKTEEFQHNVIDSFRYLTKNIFVETCRDNF